MNTIKKIFVSSTVADLIDLRSEIYEHLRKSGFMPLFSEIEKSDFEVNPAKSTIETCLLNVKNSDVFILILSKRYGSSVKEFGYDDISVTHLEFREALQNIIPTYIYIRDVLLSDYKIWKNNPGLETFSWVESSERKLFELIKECENNNGPNKPNWIQAYKNTVELKILIGKDLKSKALGLKFENDIHENRVPIIYPELVHNIKGSSLPGVNRFKANFRNYGTRPAYQLKISGEQTRLKETKCPILPPGAVISRDIDLELNHRSYNWDFNAIAEYKTVDGNEIKDIYSVRIFLERNDMRIVTQMDLKDRVYKVGNVSTIKIQNDSEYM